MSDARTSKKRCEGLTRLYARRCRNPATDRANGLDVCGIHKKRCSLKSTGVDPVDRIYAICIDAESDKLTRITEVLGLDTAEPIRGRRCLRCGAGAEWLT